MSLRLDKRRIFIGGLVLIVLIGLLAGGLRTVEFREGRRLPEWEPQWGQRAKLPFPYRWADRLLDLLPWLLLGLLILGIVLFRQALLREFGLRLVAGLLLLALLGLVIGLDQLLPEEGAVKEVEPPARGPVEPPSQGPATPIAEAGEDVPEGPGTLPWWAEYLMAMAVAVPLVLIGWGIARRFWFSRASPTESPESEGEELAAAVREAAAELRAGLPVEEVVIRCWVRMTEILAGRTGGAGGPPAVTPRELAHLLAERGVRHGAIAELTKLFEEVRYGGKADLPRREQALAALEGIEEAYYGSAHA
ncbi:TPA: DUF4129 domain-containing protein [Candidatus Bipolaricaulota bacterium]|nr:DUF4129 domain-containing protein [Candidatus Bipolaricaulota bacterium]